MDLGDIIPINITPVEGSIKISRIDNILDKKQIYKHGKWINICRYPECKEDIVKYDLCSNHSKEKRIDGEKLNRGDKIYMWSSKNESWVLLCNIFLCKKVAVKNGVCAAHLKNATTMYSSQQYTINIFNEIKKELYIQQQKKTS